MTGWSSSGICAEYGTLAAPWEIPDIRFVPVCATQGDNVVLRSTRHALVHGADAAGYLETVEIVADVNSRICVCRCNTSTGLTRISAVSVAPWLPSAAQGRYLDGAAVASRQPRHFIVSTMATGRSLLRPWR